MCSSDLTNERTWREAQKEPRLRKVQGPKELGIDPIFSDEDSLGLHAISLNRDFPEALGHGDYRRRASEHPHTNGCLETSDSSVRQGTSLHSCFFVDNSVVLDGERRPGEHGHGHADFWREAALVDNIRLKQSHDLIDASEDRQITPNWSNCDLNARNPTRITVGSYNQVDAMSGARPGGGNCSRVNRVTTVQSQINVKSKEENAHTSRVIWPSPINIWRAEYRSESRRPTFPGERGPNASQVSVYERYRFGDGRHRPLISYSSPTASSR